MIRIAVKNAKGDEISGNVEITDTDRIKNADGDFANLDGGSASSLFKLLKLWTNFDSNTSKHCAIINHCLGRKSLWEKGKTYISWPQSDEPKIVKL